MQHDHLSCLMLLWLLLQPHIQKQCVYGNIKKNSSGDMSRQTTRLAAQDVSSATLLDIPLCMSHGKYMLSFTAKLIQSTKHHPVLYVERCLRIYEDSEATQAWQPSVQSEKP